MDSEEEEQEVETENAQDDAMADLTTKDLALLLEQEESRRDQIEKREEDLLAVKKREVYFCFHNCFFDTHADSHAC